MPSYDYYTGAPDLSPNGAPGIPPGYGPNTRTIMQVKVSGSRSSGTKLPRDDAATLTALQNAFRHQIVNNKPAGVFESGQHPIVVGQAAYNSAYATNFSAASNCNAPGSTVQTCDGFVRMNDTQQFGSSTRSARRQSS